MFVDLISFYHYQKVKAGYRAVDQQVPAAAAAFSGLSHCDAVPSGVRAPYDEDPNAAPALPLCIAVEEVIGGTAGGGDGGLWLLLLLLFELLLLK